MRRFQLEESRVEKPTGRTLPPRVWRTLGCWGGNRRRTPSVSRWGLQPPKPPKASRRSTPPPARPHLRAGSTVMSFQAPRNLSVGMTRMKSPPPLRLMTLSLTSLTGQVVSQGRSRGQLTLRHPVLLPSRHVHQVIRFIFFQNKMAIGHHQILYITETTLLPSM